MTYSDETALSWFDKGREFMDGGDWLAATQAFRQAVSIDPEFGEAYAGLGAAFGNLSLWSMAVEAHTRAAALLPDDLDVVYNLGVVYGELSRTDDAEQCFRRVLAARPRDVETLLRLSEELVEQWRWLEAETEIRSAIEVEPTGVFAAHAWTFLALVLAQTDREEEARTALECARDLQPSLFDDRPDVAQLWQGLKGVWYRPEMAGVDGDDVVACGPSSRNVEDWETQCPDQVLWLGEELFYRIQREATSFGCKILPSIEPFSRFNCGEANSIVLCAEADRVFRSSTDVHVREGARLLSECINRYLQDPTERVFNIEGP
jgi:tetratricopeptide (TPR) repeat protein